VLVLAKTETRGSLDVFVEDRAKSAAHYSNALY
jgi:hypothetical protein